MEYQVLAEFVRVLRICTDTGIQAPFLQYLSIFIQNIENYCFSNDHINNIIAHPFNFGCGDLDPYYISFLRAISSKVNIGIISLLVKVHGDTVVSFPLYSAALKFSQHSERMIQTAVRAITLNLYKVSDDMVLQFLSTPPVSDYFSNLVWRLKEQCSHLDGHVHALKERFTDHGWKELLLEADKIVDEIYHLKDIISVGESCLSEAVALSLLNFLIFPILRRLLKTQQSDGSNLSVVTSYTGSELKDPTRLIFPGQSGGLDNISGNLYHRYFSDTISHFDPVRWPVEDTLIPERSGILLFAESEDCCAILASLFFLLTLAKNEGDEYFVALISEFFSSRQGMMFNALLKILTSESSMPALVQGYTGWFLHKLLISQGNVLTIFSYSRTQVSGVVIFFKRNLMDAGMTIFLLSEGRGTVAQHPLRNHLYPKTRFSYWSLLSVSKLTVDCKVIPPVMLLDKEWWMLRRGHSFILHVQLKAFISNGKFIENPLPEESTASPQVEPAIFGSDVSLGSGIPCRIAFSGDFWEIASCRETPLSQSTWESDCHRSIGWIKCKLAVS
ncbi:unnamed protein product [Linum tenue]|uniref:FPL domain-containing protein n=1 Tax=Linum tenue TaxID=586396 RepID=A0AAV0NVM5_9ROSI|nr:unnamed protein product [Linum tenue]